MKIVNIISFVLLSHCLSFADLPPVCDCAEGEINICGNDPDVCPAADFHPLGDECCQYDPNAVPMDNYAKWLILSGILIGFTIFYKKLAKA